MNAHQATAQIQQIQQQLAGLQTLRSLRPATVALTGLAGLIGAALQPWLIPEHGRAPHMWLVLWVGIAALAGGTTLTALFIRCRQSGSPWLTRLTLSATARFLPCVCAGAALTITLAATAPQTLWMLPGLWALLFSQGVFASTVVLPRQVAWAGVYYLAAGIVCLVCARDSAAFCPQAMGWTFGGGQLLTAVILHWRLERSDDEAG